MRPHGFIRSQDAGSQLPGVCEPVSGRIRTIPDGRIERRKIELFAPLHATITSPRSTHGRQETAHDTRTRRELEVVSTLRNRRNPGASPGSDRKQEGEAR
jgi:hypothetical protein